jgi:hypothetical protein
MLNLGKNLRALLTALSRSGRVKWALFAVWFFYPTVAASTWHWQDTAGLAWYVRGLLVPRVFDPADMQRAWIAIVALWLVLIIVTFLLTTAFYRATQIKCPLWVVALLMVGIVDNGVWWFAKGYFDPYGAAFGMVPVVIMAVMQRVCDRLGQAVVFGDDVPAYSVRIDLP